MNRWGLQIVIVQQANGELAEDLAHHREGNSPGDSPSPGTPRFGPANDPLPWWAGAPGREDMADDAWSVLMRPPDRRMAERRTPPDRRSQPDRRRPYSPPGPGSPPTSEANSANLFA